MAAMTGKIDRDEEINPVLLQAEDLNAKTQPNPDNVSEKEATPPAEQVAANNKSESNSVSTRTSTKTTTTALIDSPAAVTFESAIDAINQGLKEAEALSSGLSESNESTSELLNASEKLVRDSIQDNQLISNQVELAEAKAQENTEEVFEAMGGSERIVELATKRKDAVDKMLDKQADVDELVNIDPMSDPLSWLISRFSLPGAVEEANVAEATVSKLTGAINEITTLASSTDRALSEVARTKTKGTAAAVARNIARQTELDAAKLSMQAEEVNANEYKQLMEVSALRRDSIVDSYRLSLQARSEEVQQAEREARAKALKEDARFKDTLVQGVRAGRKFMGIPIYEGADQELIDKEYNEILVEYELAGESRARVDNQYNVGIGRVAPTPFQTAVAFEFSDPQKLLKNTRDNKALAVLSEAATAVQGGGLPDEFAAQPGFKLSKDNLPDVVNKTHQQMMRGYHAEVKHSDDDNPYVAIPMAELITHNAVANEPLVQKVIAPLMTDEVKDLEPEKVIQLAFTAAKDKTITFRQAVDGITNLYKQAVEVNNVRWQLRKRGLGEQTEYNAKLAMNKFFTLDVAGAMHAMKFGEKRSADLTKFDEVSRIGVNLLSRELTAGGAPVVSRDEDSFINQLLEGEK